MLVLIVDFFLPLFFFLHFCICNWLRQCVEYVYSDDMDKLGKVQSSFWREWKLKLEEQKRLTEHSRALEKIIPGVETERFLSRDSIYIVNVVISLIESVKLERKHILKDILKLVDTYDLNWTEVWGFAGMRWKINCEENNVSYNEIICLIVP